MRGTRSGAEARSSKSTQPMPFRSRPRRSGLVGPAAAQVLVLGSSSIRHPRKGLHDRGRSRVPEEPLPAGAPATRGASVISWESKNESRAEWAARNSFSQKMGNRSEVGSRLSAARTPREQSRHAEERESTRAGDGREEADVVVGERMGRASSDRRRRERQAVRTASLDIE